MEIIRPPPTVTHLAVSVLSSRTMWVNAAALLVAVLSLTEVVTIIAPRFIPTYTALLAILNLALRMLTVRPVVLSAPGTITPVEVESLTPPGPVVTD